MTIASSLLHPWVILAGMGPLVIWLIHRLRVREALLTVLTVGGGLLVVKAMKAIIAKSRPTDAIIEAVGWSFPSGHSAGAVLVSAVIVYVFVSRVESRGLRMLAYLALAVFVTLVGMSRVYLGVHYPTDVMAGYIVGALWAMFVFYVGSRK